MDPVSMEALLSADEEKLRQELRADEMIDKSRARSVERLRDALGEALLRYNAANTGDRTRQAMADCLAATVGEMLGLLNAGTVRTESEARRVRVGAVGLLALSCGLALAAALLIKTYFLAGCGLLAACALSLYISGRIWYAREESRVSPGLDADIIWKVIRRTGETMDAKIAGFSELERAWEAEREAQKTAGDAPMDPEELQLMGDLLEALYAENGEYSLRQLKKLLPYLRKRGIELLEYDGSNPAAFDVMPTVKETRTLRPALMAGDRLLLPGRAAEHEN